MHGASYAPFTPQHFQRIYPRQSYVSYFCQKHDNKACKAELDGGYHCWQQLQEGTRSSFCDSHRCIARSGGGGRERCLRQLDGYILGEWPLCRACDSRLARCHAATQSHPKKRCENAAISKLHCYKDIPVNEKTYHKGYYYRKHACSRSNCRELKLQGFGTCYKHSGCPHMIGNQRCWRVEIPSGTFCSSHTCRFQPLYSYMCLLEAAGAGGNCTEHAVCTWSNECGELQDHGKRYCVGHKCASQTENKATYWCESGISGKKCWKGRYGLSDFCRTHKCAIESCGDSNANGSQWCTEHGGGTYQ